MKLMEEPDLANMIAEAEQRLMELVGEEYVEYKKGRKEKKHV